MTTVRSFVTLLLVFLFLLYTFPLRAPYAAQHDAPSLISEPTSLRQTVALGANQGLTLSLQNSGTSPVNLRLLRALGHEDSPTLAAPSLPPALPQHNKPRVDPQIAQAQAEDPLGRSEFLVLLEDQADLSAAYLLNDWYARGDYVYRTLHAHAARTQAPLRALLDARGISYTPFWIMNALAVHGDASTVAALAADLRVAQIRAFEVAHLDAPSPSVPRAELQQLSLCAADDQHVCWNIRQVGANRVWNDFGVRGTGITVASIDSGVMLEHPALLAAYRGNQGGRIEHRYNWYDPYGSAPSPSDAGIHGTHVTGIMVGRGTSASNPAIGVAPGANWIAARACSARDCNEADIIQAAQWLLAPTDTNGRNPRPDLRPHIINNSWTSGQDNAWFTSYVNAWRAAGIYPVFAGGNSGNTRQCSTVQSPGDFPNVTAVGATDSNKALVHFSSIGPTLDGRIKPDLVAPGSSVISSVDDSRIYASLNGTSMAAPHVAAGVALLWAANPALLGDYAATYAALTRSAEPIDVDSRFGSDTFANCPADQLPNNIIGYGLLNLHAAVGMVSVDVPWLHLDQPSPTRLAAGERSSISVTLDASRVPGPGRYQGRILVYGDDLNQSPLAIPVTMEVPADPSHATVQGQVTRSSDGTPLNASVSVATGPTVATDATGSYSLTLAPATSPYQLSASAQGHTTVTSSLTLSATQQVTRNFALEEQQPSIGFDPTPQSFTLTVTQVISASFPISNEGSSALNYSATIPNERYGVWRSDEADGPSSTWREPPASAERLIPITLEHAALSRTRKPIGTPCSAICNLQSTIVNGVRLTNGGTSAAIPLGFSFPFFENNYEELRIGAHGLLLFGQLPSGELNFSEQCLPLSETSGPSIAVLRARLDPSHPAARISYAQLNVGFLVSWQNVPLADNPDVRLSFQALLQPDGRISLHYENVSGLGPEAWASVGVQRSRFNSQNVSCRNDRPLQNGLSIELRPQPGPSNWISINTPIGNLEPNEQGAIAAQLMWHNPRGQAWPFSATLEVRSNDPQQPIVRKSIRAQAEEPGYQVLLPLVVR
ncbi:S8 family serine peptidase [Candidatus Viridilinea mediisalina]|uniref:Peptidase S8/S53 domain-containing protein n=1 Tax=Candidatus Viridilinea mediisalina TaxID=2024553 RepID=A0A2A6RFY5_9CHLR|nr:S8 family serine peptidase [Candidatus Viridilinea mediisalina]PDW02044.1 hypothetical protein CJ255_16045 [Candidatus Viridilinea mediisalina]